ncbi:MAG: glycosyltransferase, partial [Bacteroidetes bacterium]|nr:glycosyltransferase [Bacteroidota bacterium]
MDDGTTFILVLRIIEKLIIIYFSLYLLIDLALFFYALFAFVRKKQSQSQPIEYKNHRISLLVPAYNEEVSIVDCVRTLLKLDYPAYEVVVINDGSKDDTFEKLATHFNLVPKETVVSPVLHSHFVRGVYEDTQFPLKVIDKENGGKADAINAGINYSDGEYVCTIDADSILDESALKKVIEPFVTSPDTMVSGGQLAASNGLHIKDNKIVKAETPTNIWVIWQIIEYIRSFMISRTGLSRIDALLIMSGAFSLYRKSEVEAVGGFLSKVNDHPYVTETVGAGKHTVCEDMEIVVRLYRHRKQQKQKAKVVFLPSPVCWTEVPEKGINLYKQRSRWHQGLAESLFLHREIMLEPAYGMLGMLGLPYYFFFELLAP